MQAKNKVLLGILLALVGIFFIFKTSKTLSLIPMLLAAALTIIGLIVVHIGYNKLKS